MQFHCLMLRSTSSHLQLLQLPPSTVCPLRHLQPTSTTSPCTSATSSPQRPLSATPPRHLLSLSAHLHASAPPLPQQRHFSHLSTTSVPPLPPQRHLSHLHALQPPQGHLCHLSTTSATSAPPHPLRHLSHLSATSATSAPPLPPSAPPQHLSTNLSHLHHLSAASTTSAHLKRHLCPPPPPQRRLCPLSITSATLRATSVPPLPFQATSAPSAAPQRPASSSPSAVCSLLVQVCGSHRCHGVAVLQDCFFFFPHFARCPVSCKSKGEKKGVIHISMRLVVTFWILCFNLLCISQWVFHI